MTSWQDAKIAGFLFSAALTLLGMMPVAFAAKGDDEKKPVGTRLVFNGGHEEPDSRLEFDYIKVKAGDIETVLQSLAELHPNDAPPATMMPFPEINLEAQMAEAARDLPTTAAMADSFAAKLRRDGKAVLDHRWQKSDQPLHEIFEKQLRATYATAKPFAAKYGPDIFTWTLIVVRCYDMGKISEIVYTFDRQVDFASLGLIAIVGARLYPGVFTAGLQYFKNLGKWVKDRRWAPLWTHGRDWADNVQETRGALEYFAGPFVKSWLTFAVYLIGLDAMEQAVGLKSASESFDWIRIGRVSIFSTISEAFWWSAIGEIQLTMNKIRPGARKFIDTYAVPISFFTFAHVSTFFELWAATGKETIPVEFMGATVRNFFEWASITRGEGYLLLLGAAGLTTQFAFRKAADKGVFGEVPDDVRLGTEENRETADNIEVKSERERGFAYGGCLGAFAN